MKPTRSQMTQDRPTQRGFTMVEVLIAVVVLSIGLLAMSALQIVYIGGSGAAHDSTEGTQIADSAIESLRTEGVMWNSRNPILNNNTHPKLNAIVAGGDQWVSIVGGRAVNYTNIDTSVPGNVVNPGTPLKPWEINAKYCVEARGRWQEQNRVLSGEVRVAWPADGGKGQGSIITADGNCERELNALLYPGGIPDTRFNVVYIPFVIRRYDI